MRKIFVYVIVAGVGFGLAGCSLFTRKHQAGTAAEVNGNYLYFTELNEITSGLSPVDSAVVADEYIRQWATEILVYDKARDKGDKQIEALTEDYRRSLYVHEYEQRLLSRMPKHASEAQIDSFYATHKNAYILKENLVRGILLIVPTGAPDQNKLLKWLNTPTAENIENIEKYAYRYASGYELFTDEWKTTNELLLLIPISQSALAQELRQKKQIVKTDAQKTYFLQVTDKRLSGEPMPIEYARDEIERLLLRDSAVNYLKSEHEKLYNDAVRRKKIKFYENN